jgi:hypothetical protein
MRRRSTLAAAVVAAVLLAGAVRGQAVPSPEEFFGFKMGADRALADWTRTVEYFRTLDRLSDRMVVQELGPTTDGRPYIAAIVSSPDTIANLAAHREVQRRLADPRLTSAGEADALARDAKVVVLIGGSVHGNEIGSTQMLNALVHELVTAEGGWVARVLKEAIVLLVPSQNPDGVQLQAEWASEHAGTRYEDAPLPELYHRYAGHDNNRDSYMLTQRETQYLARLTYHDWLPEVYLDQHQMGSGRARIFVPPFRNPANPNVDPLVWSEVNLLGQAMAARLQAEGKTGVLWGEIYSGFWQGANSTNPWWHNMIAPLTEVASARTASPLFQQQAWSRNRAAAARPGTPQPGDVEIPPPSDTQPRMNYPEPWLGGRWTFADVVDYHRLAAIGLLEAVANNRALLVRNFQTMQRRTIERFEHGHPYAYVVPGAQHDPGAATQLLALLQGGGAEVHRAEAPFTADGRDYPAGTPVVLLAQPFGRWVKDLLERQTYPDIRWPSPSAPFERPYDTTAWTLGLLMDVDTVAVDSPFEARLERMGPVSLVQSSRVHGTGSTYLIPHEPNASATATHRLLAAGADVSWTTEPMTIGGTSHPAGTIVVTRETAASMSAAIEGLGLDVSATSSAVSPNRLLPLRLPRIAVYEPWGGAIDAGWTRWVFERHDLPYTRVRQDTVRSGELTRRFDVLVIPEMPAALIVRGLQGSNVPPAYRGGLGDEGLSELRAFIDGGGSVILLGNSAEFATEYLGVPLSPVTSDSDPETFSCPGSLLRVAIDTTHPIGYGMRSEAAAMVVNNMAYAPTARAAGAVATVARYPDAPLLLSGWITGEPVLRGAGAIFDIPMGRGRIILHTFRVQHRAQTVGTFKLLFNSILYAASGSRAGTSF